MKGFTKDFIEIFGGLLAHVAGWTISGFVLYYFPGYFFYMIFVVPAALVPIGMVVGAFLDSIYNDGGHDYNN